MAAKVSVTAARAAASFVRRAYRIRNSSTTLRGNFGAPPNPPCVASNSAMNACAPRASTGANVSARSPPSGNAFASPSAGSGASAAGKASVRRRVTDATSSGVS